VGESQDIILKVKNLVKHYPISSGFFFRTVETVKAVDGISFNIPRGKTLGVVGESGCGKTTLGRVILRLLEPTGGKVFFEGKDLFNLSREEIRKLRKDMQIIFQDPFTSLDPRMMIGDQIGEPLEIHEMLSSDARKRKVQELLEIVGLSLYHYHKYPHEFSGGQRQRIGVARALALNPKFIVCDEPVSALDVSIQSQVLNLLKDLQDRYHLTYLFISHDLSVINHMSDTVVVMYLGKIVEMAPVHELFSHPLHPYTRALFSAIPIPDPKDKRKRIFLTGDVPNPAHVPSGCRFHTRCRYKRDECLAWEPELKDFGRGHFTACHLC